MKEQRAMPLLAVHLAVIQFNAPAGFKAFLSACTDCDRRRRLMHSIRGTLVGVVVGWNTERMMMVVECAPTAVNDRASCASVARRGSWVI